MGHKCWDYGVSVWGINFGLRAFGIRVFGIRVF